MRSFSIVVVLWIGVAGPPAAAQAVRSLSEPPAFVLDQWTTADGLPQNSVNAIVQAPDGYLWIGTFGGLVRFDGTEFRLEERVDSAGRHLDRVLALAVGRDSALWIGTETGLLRRRHGTFQAFGRAEGFLGQAVSALHVDRAGTLWIGTQQRGIARFVNGRFDQLAAADGVPFDHVMGFVEGTDGTLWVNTERRLLTVQPGSTLTARTVAPPLRGAANLVLDDGRGRWFSLADGMAGVAGGTVRVFRRGAGVWRPSLMVARPEGYWVGTDNDGLFFFRPDGGGDLVRRYPLPDGRLQYRVRAAHVDLEGNVWFGTNANGLLRAKRNLFTTYTTAHGLSHDVMTAVFSDAAGTLWAATNCGGVNAIEPVRGVVRTFKPRRPGDPAGDPCVFALTEAPAGTMWIGTYGGGLTRIRGGREERLRRTAGLRDSVVIALYTDRDGRVWVGMGTGGLAVLEDGRVRRTYTTADGLAHNSVRIIYQTADAAIWVGTVEGLSRLAAGRVTTYGAADGLGAEHVRALYEDAGGILWVGTYGGGLHRLQEGRFTAVTRRDGLGDDVVSAILEDAHGYFWMSGNRGVYRVAREELIAFTEGRVRHVHAVLYGTGDGLVSAETNGGFQPAAWKDAGGRLWFPTVQGVAMVDPATVSIVQRPPPAVLEEVVADGVALEPADGLRVGPGRPNLEFRYAGLSLSAPQHVVYRYRLIGFDPGWVDAGTRRVAYYPRLPPGSYRFEVTAANRDGVWNEAGTALALRVLAPFWATWWFRIAAAASLLAGAGVVVRQRTRRAREARAAQDEFSRRLIESQEHERKRIAGELHDGLGQELLVIKNRAQLALRADHVAGAAREQLEQILDVATHSLEDVRGLAHNLTPYQLEHLGVTTALRTMIETAADPADVALDVGVESIDGLLTVDGEINLYRIVQEALSNVVRHAGARSARIRVRRAGNRVVVTIQDDGRGFAVKRDGGGRLTGGFGLSGIAERVRILGGRVDVASTPGRGTRLELSVPVAAGTRWSGPAGPEGGTP